MAILEEILSANGKDREESSEQCQDIDIQYFIETEVNVLKEPEMESEGTAVVDKPSPKRRQAAKRKVSEVETQKPKANKRSKSSVNEKRERKRNQNKSAANRYRIKKRVEMESIETVQSEYQKLNQQLTAELEKLQMEFKVVYPLAKAAFTSDPKKTLQLQALDLRVLRDNLLE